MKLSVILPCYNSAATIAVQLEALTQQAWSGGWEVVVSNNGSTDDSMAIVERYRDRLPELRIVNAYVPPGPRLGVSHSYNLGIKGATGSAFVFCEADDEVAPGWLEAMGQALMQYEFVVGSLEYDKLNEPWRLEGFTKVWRTQITGLTEIPFSPYFPYASGCAFGLRRSLYDAVGAFNPLFPYSHDTEYCWRAQFMGFQLHFVADAVIHYRLRHTYGAISRQGQSWGKDFILLRKYYRSPMGRLDLVRACFSLFKSLPRGGQLLLLMLLKAPRSRGEFSVWYWQLGFYIGVIKGLLTKPPIAPKDNPVWSIPNATQRLTRIH